MQYNFDEYADRVIQRYKLKKKNETEFGEQPCPNCGGSDRFWISNFNGELKHHCRQNCDPLERLQAMKKDGALRELYYDVEPLYHHRKRIPLLAAYRQYSKTIVKLVNVKTHKFAGNQTILPSGKKIFSKGLVKEGVGAFIGKQSSRLYVCEGWATAVAVHLATDQQALFALDAKTLPKTVRLLKHPEIVIAADNDAEGIEAARATGLPWAAPERDGADWWDVFDRDGKEAVKAGLSAASLFQKTKASQTEAAPNGTVSHHNVKGFEFSPFEDISEKTFEPVSFLVNKIVPEVGLTLISGSPKIGKSYFCFYLISQMPRDRTVFYLGNKDNDRRLQTRLKQIFPFDVPKKLMLFSGLSNEKPLPRGREALELFREIKTRYPDCACIVIDTVQGIRKISEAAKGYETTEAEFGALRKCAHELSISIIAVHHNRKQTEISGSPLESILGSQGIAATVETALVLKQVTGSQHVDLFVSGKDVEQQEIRLHWENPGFSEIGDALEASLGPFQRKCLTYIKEHPRCTQAAICDATHHAKSTVSEAIARLTQKRLVSKTIDGRLVVFPTNRANPTN